METVNILIVPHVLRSLLFVKMKREKVGCSSGILICREGFFGGFGMFVYLFIEKRNISQFVLMLKM